MKLQPGVGYNFDSSAHGFTLDTSDPFPASTATVVGHPFKIINVALRTSGGSTTVTYQVQSGTLNNLVPNLDDYISGTTVKLDRITAGVANPPTAELDAAQYNGTTKTSYIYLRAGPNASAPFEFPREDSTSDRYPAVGGYNAENALDTDIYAYLKVGSITVDSIAAPTTFTVNQYVSGSLWADRIKLAGITARYYYARI